MRALTVGPLARLLLAALAATASAETIPGRYLLELSAAPGARALVRAEQARMRPRLESRRIKVLGGVERVGNLLFIEASDAAIQEIARWPGVKGVWPMRTHELLTDRAAVVNRVWDALARIGGPERGGEGIRIGIIDTGIDVDHPTFSDAGFPMPAGYPKIAREEDRAFTNGKVIAARSYVHLNPNPGPDPSPRDHSGHGTMVASVAAGNAVEGPLGRVQGMAPAARVGNYRVFGGGGASNAAVIAALEDALADGMHVVNLSLGSPLNTRLEDDPEVRAVERVVSAGVVVVAAAGNSGPDYFTLDSPADAPSAIAVGSHDSDRRFSASVQVPDAPPLEAVAGQGYQDQEPISGALSDVARLDGDGLACQPLPADSLAKRLALIGRGTCAFTDKLAIAKRAGAVAAIIIATAAAPDPIMMGLVNPELPGLMVSFSDGQRLREWAARETPAPATAIFRLGAFPSEPFVLAPDSAAGPGPGIALKPELVAVGRPMYAATQRNDPQGDDYSPTGFSIGDGTSFASPVVAGTAAILLAARPGLTVSAVRSLLINSARAIPGPALRTGAGALDALAALETTLTADPAVLALTEGDAVRAVRLRTLGTVADRYSIEVQSSAAAKPRVPSFVSIEPGVDAVLDVDAGDLRRQPPGTYEGAIVLTSVSSGQSSRIPYWFAVPTGAPSSIVVLQVPAAARRGASVNIYFRVVDVTGMLVNEPALTVSVAQGGGAITQVRPPPPVAPGVYQIVFRMGNAPGTNVIRLRAGEVTRDVLIVGE